MAGTYRKKLREQQAINKKLEAQLAKFKKQGGSAAGRR